MSNNITIAKLQDKSVTITQNGTTVISPDNGYTGIHSVNVDVDILPPGQVNFYDYEGTLVTSYTGEEIQSLQALPNAPDHSSDEVPLTFDEWNWTLSEIKSYNTSYPTADINVGANYHTTDGKTHFYFKNSSKLDGLGVGIYLYDFNSSTDTVDWGDGTVESITNRNIYHIYSSVGEFHCIIDSICPQYAVGGIDSTRRTSRSKLTKVYFANTLTTLTYGSFANCYNLEKLSIPNTLTSLGVQVFYYDKSLKGVVIPKSISILETQQFYLCNSLKIACIPNGVTNIKANAFYNCISMKSITIPSSTTNLGQNVLSYCNSLESITVPNSVNTIGTNAFSNNISLRSIVLSNTLTLIADYTFYMDYLLESIVIPNSVTSIGENVFRNCYCLKSLVIPNTVTSVGRDAFNGCFTIESITLPNSLSRIEPYMFNECRVLKSLSIPNSVTTIDTYSISNCESLQSLIIPEGVTTVNNYVFGMCSSLQEIIFPSTLTSIGLSPVSNDYSLYSITLLATTPPTFTGTFVQTSLAKIYVPYSSDHSILEAYKSATNWSNYASIMEELPST